MNMKRHRTKAERAREIREWMEQNYVQAPARTLEEIHARNIPERESRDYGDDCQCGKTIARVETFPGGLWHVHTDDTKCTFERQLRRDRVEEDEVWRKRAQQWARKEKG